MKIAVTHMDGKIFQHFGHSEEFKLYEVADGKIINEKIIKPSEGGHGALALFLKNCGAEILICGGIGAGAKNALADIGIKLYPGAEGECDKAVDALLKGNLIYSADIQCDHNHDKNHTCGSACGENKHGCGGN